MSGQINDFVREIKRGVQRTRSEIERANTRMIREVWEGFGNYHSHLKEIARSIGLAKKITDRVERTVEARIEEAYRNIEWSKLSPDVRRILAERISRSLRERKGDRQEEFPERMGRIYPRQPQRPLGKIVPKPSPKREREEEGDIPAPPRLLPPSPVTVLSVRPTPPPKRREFRSRVGYFASISELGFYESLPSEETGRVIELDMQDQPDGHLSLGPGESWVSPWFETGIIRGLSVDVSGTHKIVYSKNGSFEL